GDQLRDGAARAEAGERPLNTEADLLGQVGGVEPAAHGAGQRALRPGPDLLADPAEQVFEGPAVARPGPFQQRANVLMFHGRSPFLSLTGLSVNRRDVERSAGATPGAKKEGRPGPIPASCTWPSGRSPTPPAPAWPSSRWSAIPCTPRFGRGRR